MNSRKKIVTLKSLKRIVQKLRRRGKAIAFTNGCFDILHFGHISYLEKAKHKDRILIVGLNSDASARKIKGPKRPIIGQNQRAGVLAALGYVDYITIFNEETPYKTIKALKPDILIKGADWRGKSVAGEKLVKSLGGRVEFVKYLNRFSTTKIIDTIIKKCKKKI